MTETLWPYVTGEGGAGGVVAWPPTGWLMTRPAGAVARGNLCEQGQSEGSSRQAAAEAGQRQGAEQLQAGSRQAGRQAAC